MTDTLAIQHEIKSAIVRSGGVSQFVMRCSCRGFECAGPRLGTAHRRKAARLAAEHLRETSNGIT